MPPIVTDDWRWAYKSAWNLRQIGVTCDPIDVLALWHLADGRCDACGTQVTRGGPMCATTACVDHDHTSGRLRGILCHRCNVVEGYVHTHGAEGVRAVLAYHERA